MKENKAISPIELTDGKLLAKNTVWNLVGQGTPLIAAIFSIPLLVKGLGIERFGLLTLAWLVVGYVSLLDFGIGRALTKILSEKLGSGNPEDVPGIAWSALFLMLLLGVGGTIFAASLSPWLVFRILKIPSELQQETLNALYLLSLSIPVVIGTAGLRGILEAYQRFELVNAIRVPMGLFIFLGPVFVLPFTKSLFWVVSVLVGGRVLAWFVHLYFCLHVATGLKECIVIRREFLWVIILFGGWMTVSNIIGPVMVYMDRFVIGVLMAPNYVAYYATPFEAATYLHLIPGPLVGVLFPAFSLSYFYDSGRTTLLFRRGVKYTFLALFPVSLFIVCFSKEILGYWLGGDFAKNSTRVLQLLIVGRFINGLAQMPFALIQSAGRPDITAKIHLIELPFFVLFVWWMIGSYGIEGAAIAWVLRVSVDALLLFGVSQRMLPVEKANLVWILSAVITALSVLALSTLLVGVVVKSIFLLLTLIAFLLIAWHYILDNLDKQKIVAFFGYRFST